MGWDQEQPIMPYIRELIGQLAPEVGESWGRINHYPNHPLKGVGGYVKRKNARGGFSRHSEGRACDIYVNVKELYLWMLGNALFKGFAASGRELGIEDLLWDTYAWSHGDPTVHRNPDTDSVRRHQDHLHVGFSRAASQTRPPLVRKIITEAVAYAK